MTTEQSVLKNISFAVFKSSYFATAER